MGQKATRKPHAWIQDRLRELRRQGRYKNQTKLAEALGLDKSGVSFMIAGTRNPKHKEIRIIASYLELPVETVLSSFAGGSATEHRDWFGYVPIVCRIGAGSIVYPLDDYELGNAADFIERPPGLEQTELVSVRIEGDSMHPLRSGWLVFYSKAVDGIDPAALGRLSAVKLANDGPLYIKELHRGSEPGRMTLTAWNAPPVENVEVEWAAPILHIACR